MKHPDEEVIRCEHTSCMECGHPIWVEYDLVDGVVQAIFYDDLTDDSSPIIKCPECEAGLSC